MYCSHCGAALTDDSAFCQYCGTKMRSDIARESGHTENESASTGSQNPVLSASPDGTHTHSISKRKKTVSFRKSAIIGACIAAFILLAALGAVLFKSSTTPLFHRNKHPSGDEIPAGEVQGERNKSSLEADDFLLDFSFGQLDLYCDDLYIDISQFLEKEAAYSEDGDTGDKYDYYVFHDCTVCIVNQYYLYSVALNNVPTPRGIKQNDALAKLVASYGVTSNIIELLDNDGALDGLSYTYSDPSEYCLYVIEFVLNDNDESISEIVFHA